MDNEGKRSGTDPVISFKNFTFQYRAQKEPTLFDISLDIRRGEKILIAGPSGCGKSTLAHCLNGLAPCSLRGTIQGELTVDGLVPAKEGVFGMSKVVGTVLQDTDGQFIGLTVAEDLAFALENDAVPQEEIFRRVDAAADIVDMKDYLHHAPTELSGGQKQRVSMGGVLVDDVKVLLFDEPLANLDPATGKRTIALIDEILKKEGVTVIIIEHRLEDVLYRDVDRIVLMDEGRIIADMDPDSMLASDILVRTGIREPLYVSAIKQAGCAIDPKDRPEHIESMNVEPYRERVRAWFSGRAPMPEKAPGKEVLAVEHLSFHYTPGEPVLRDVSFSVREGEMVSIVGRNGAGKSTLAGLICGFHKPVEGRILLEGADIAPLSVKERGECIGLVMQSPNQMISKPMIMEEVGLGLAVRGTDPAEVEERVHETLKICGLYPYRNWPVSALSFGQKKRVSIASILVMNPKILILDEPTAGQDFRRYTEIMEFLKQLNEDRGLTILMITHDMHLMLEYTDRAIVLSGGKLLMDSTPAAVLTDEAVADSAYLKKTSLYDLAVCCGIEPVDFTNRFISCEREERKLRKEGRGEA